jgi:hypothetical protein
MSFRIFIFGLLINLTANGQGFLRGPFLQSATQSSIIIKWRSDSSNNFTIKIGQKEDSLHTFGVINSNINTEVLIDKLLPNTKYFYAISNVETGTIASYFYTLPVTSSHQKMQFVAFGDCGTHTPKQKEVLAAVKNYFGSQRIDGMMLLGDNAYSYGLDEEYQGNFFNIYQDELLKNTVLWPSLGNHDYADRVWPSNFGTYPAYFHIFSLPTQGESGGLASNSEAYYSYDVGNVHFVSLDSYGKEEGKRMADLMSAQADWLQKDLGLNKQDWTVVYFHHPPFSKGSHDSDKEQELVDIRNNLTPIFDKYNVDLVMNGHSHSYERSYLLNGYQGDENSFRFQNHTLSSSSGKYNGEDNSCPYVKSDSGTVYLVAGTGGWSGRTSEGYPHNAMYYSTAEETGAVILTVENNRFEVKYLSSTGIILDNFVMMKNVNKNSEYVIDCGELIGLEKSWNGVAIWNKNFISSDFKIDSLIHDTLLIATDKYVCLTDTFKVSVNPYPEPSASSNSPVLETNDLTLFSTFEGEGSLQWTGPNNYVSIEENPIISSVERAFSGSFDLSASYKTCLSSTQINIEIIPLLGIEEEGLKATFSAYPNPVNSVLKIDFIPSKSEGYTFRIFNLIGELLHEKSLKLQANSENIIEFNLSNLTNDNKLILKAESSQYHHEQLISLF